MSLLMNACFVGNRKKENDIYLTTFFSVSCATLLFVFLFFFLMFLLFVCLFVSIHAPAWGATPF